MKEAVQLIAVAMTMALFIEGFVQWFKSDYRKNPWVWLSLGTSVFGVVATGFNPLVVLDVAGPYPWLTECFGYFMGTVIVARGPNHVSDFFGAIKSINAAIKT